MNETRRSRWESPWVWIGIGCVVLILGVGSFLGLFFLRFQQVRHRFRTEPIVAVAEAMAKRGQSLAVVSRDPKNHTVTLRNRKTGERFLLGQVGKTELRIETEAGQIVIPFIGRGGILGRGSSTRLLLGSSAGPPPSWLPSVPGTKIRPIYVFEGKWGASGNFALDSSVPIPEVVAFYGEQLTRSGFRLKTEETHTADGTIYKGIASSPDGRTSSIFAFPHSRPEILVSYSEGEAARAP